MTSNPFVNIGIYIERRVNDNIYEKLTKRGGGNVEDYPFDTKKDLFLAAACVGAKNDKFKKNTGATLNPFSGETFNPKIDVPILFSLAFKKENDIEVLLDPKKVIEIAQGWANGGIELLHDYIFGNSGRPLFNFVNMILDSNKFPSENSK